MKCLLCPKHTGPGQLIESIHPGDLKLIGDELVDVHTDCARQRRADLKDPQKYLWYCTACDQTFFGGETSPSKCSGCGRSTNGGFGLPFGAYPDTDRVDIEAQTFTPYEGDNEWVRSANGILEGHALIGKQLKAFTDHGVRLNKREAMDVARKVMREN